MSLVRIALILLSVGVGIFAALLSISILNHEDQKQYQYWQDKQESVSSEIKQQDFATQDAVRCKGDALCLTEKITRIIDGDTIYLENGYKIRLSLTNTPERHEIGFSNASQFTAQMCPVGSIAMVDQDDLQPYDVYDRMLGKVVCGGAVLNSELLYAGHANILSRYCHTSEFANEDWAQGFGC